MSRLFWILLVLCALDARAASLLVATDEPPQADVWTTARFYLVLEPGEEAVGFTGALNWEGDIARLDSGGDNPSVQPWLVWMWDESPTSPNLTINTLGPFSYTDPQPVEWTSAAGPLIVAMVPLRPNVPGTIIVRVVEPLYRLDRVVDENVQVLVAPAGTVVAQLYVVPEPGSAALAAVGLAALLTLRAKRRRSESTLTENR